MINPLPLSGIRQQLLSPAARCLYAEYTIQAKYYQFTDTHQSLTKLRTMDKNNTQNKHNAKNKSMLCLYIEVTKPMEQCPSSEAALSSVIREILRVAWKRSVHYRYKNSQPLVLNLSQLNHNFF